MAADGEKPKLAACGKTKKRKYLPHGKPVRKGPYPLHPGVQGFFITCDGGRERQAANDAVNILENFYEELLGSKDIGTKSNAIPSKPLNKITKFHDSDSSVGEEESDVENGKAEEPGESEETPSKKQRLETDATCEQSVSNAEEKTIDALIEDELEELGDRKKRHFVSLDSGCNGCIFIQMNKRDGDPTPSSIVQHMMTSAASSRKHMSRFILRVLPAEVACYASVEEIMKAIEPLMSHYFPTEATSPQKFAVLYEARANTGIDRMKIIDAVAKSVPQPHKVDLSNPDKTIIVQIAKTICLLSVVERYKELSKYNLRQLTTAQKN